MFALLINDLQKEVQNHTDNEIDKLYETLTVLMVQPAHWAIQFFKNSIGHEHHLY